jgi:hypothetical protein
METLGSLRESAVVKPAEAHPGCFFIPSVRPPSEECNASAANSAQGDEATEARLVLVRGQGGSCFNGYELSIADSENLSGPCVDPAPLEGTLSPEHPGFRHLDLTMVAPAGQERPWCTACA